MPRLPARLRLLSQVAQPFSTAKEVDEAVAANTHRRIRVLVTRNVRFCSPRKRQLTRLR